MMITQINFIFWCFYKSNDSNDDDDNEFDYDDDNEYYDNDNEYYDNDENNVVYDIIHNYRCIYNYIHYCVQKED